MKIFKKKNDFQQALYLLLIFSITTLALSCFVDIDTVHAHGHSDDVHNIITLDDTDESQEEQLECEDLSEEAITSRVSFHSGSLELVTPVASIALLRHSLEIPNQFPNPPSNHTVFVPNSRFTNVTQLPRSQLGE